MEQIENREIRGLTAKTVLSLLSGWGTIIISIMFAYYNLKADIKDTARDRDNDNKFSQYQILSLKQHLEIIDIQIKELGKRIDDQAKQKGF